MVSEALHVHAVEAAEVPRVIQPHAHLAHVGQSAASQGQGAISALLLEERRFPPSEEFRAEANASDPGIYDRAISEGVARFPGGGEPRGIFCGMGVCFDCLVVVDGVTNTRACAAWAREGMDVRRQAGFEALRGDA